MKDYQCIELDLDDDGILTIRLNRPERLNAVNDQLHTELAHVFADAERDSAVHVCILTGAGRAFSAGGDFSPGTDLDEFRREVFGDHPARGPVYKIVHDLIWMTKPIIAAVNGPAVGLGATLALLCDIVYMAEDARIGDRHVNMGLTAGDGGAIIWPLLVGVNLAKEHLMTGKLLTASEAHAMRLVNHVVRGSDLISEVTKMAQTLRRLPPLAVQTTKAITNRSLMLLFNSAMETSAEFEARSIQTNDAAEAIAAFIEKREPHFTGT